MAQVLVHRTNQRQIAFGNVRVLNAALVVGASLLMAIYAHVSIPLWFTPVPITLQTFGVMLLALTIGGWRASAALVLYLLEGVSGLPVFSPSGPGGIAQLMGATGGFLMATPFAAFVAGYFAERKRPALLTLGAVSAEVILFALGATWFTFVT